jgi:Protein of unknown function (DUF998)
MIHRAKVGPETRPPATAALIAAGAAITNQVLLFALIVLRPDLDPSWHTLSEWAIGPYGWLMKTAFFVSALAYAALFVTLRRQVGGAVGRVGLWMLFACVIGTVGVGLFTTDPLDGPLRAPSTTGALHILFGTVALFLLPFAGLLINLSLALKNPAWAARRLPLLWTAGLPLFGFLGFVIYTACFVVPLGPNARGPGVNIGWPPRFAFLTYTVWLTTLSWQALRVQAPRQATDGAAAPGSGRRKAHEAVHGPT